MEKREHVTVRVRAALYDEVLEWINERRKEHGLRTLRKIPNGLGAESEECPIARAVRDTGYTSVEGTETAAIDEFTDHIDGELGSNEGKMVHVVRGLR